MQIGNHADTAPTVYVTLTRQAADTVTDMTQVASAVLELPDGSTQTLTVSGTTPPTVSAWNGTARYNAWFPTGGTYPCDAKATFTDSTVMTFIGELVFAVAS